MAEHRVLKVFISSPSDVPDARAEAVRQVQKLNDDPAISAEFLIEIIEYERAPPIAGRPPQETINEYMGRAATSDLVICVFGQWFGTEHFIGGRSYPSGTYYEFSTAERAYRRSRGIKPIILLYRMLRDPPPPESTDEVKEQAQRVEDFFRDFKSQASIYQGLYEEHREIEGFSASLASKLKPVILKEFSQQKVAPRSQSLANRFGLRIDYEVSRADMISKVRQIWVDGVLNDLTSRVVASFETPIQVGKALGSSTGTQSASARHLSHGEHLRLLFDDADHQLIILGQQGAGKTFKLLELTSALLDRAEETPSLPIPVVFNLSSWTGRGESMADWLVSQLVSVYRLPHKIARRWVDKGKIALCLDGLDEITVGGTKLGSDQEKEAQRLRDDRRRECLEALDEYARTGVWLALCCREPEFTPLKTKIHTRRGDAAFITIGPLSAEQVEDYMEATKWELRSLRQAMKDDSTLREMAQIPFLLTAMALAYRDEQGVSESGIIEGGKGGTENRLRDLFEKYVLVRCNGSESISAEQYSLPDIRHYLGELARKMEGKSKLLLVEQLQPDWLPTSSRWKYVALVSLFLFLFMSLSIGLPSGAAIGYEWAAVTGSLMVGLYYGLKCALATAFFSGGIIAGGFALSKTWGFGVAAGLTLGAARGIITGISPNEGGWSASVRVGLISSLMGIIVLAPLMKLRKHTRDEILPLESRKWDSHKALLGIVAAVGVGGVFWAAFGKARGLGFGLGLMPVLTLAFGNLGTGFEVKTYPNQGIRQSAVTAGRIALFSGITGMICFGISYGFSLGLKEGIINTILGMTLAACSLGFGAMPCMQHLSLRWVLASHRIAPFKIVDFLEEASDLYLLRRVGGGYMFQHEYLRNYFRTLH